MKYISLTKPHGYLIWKGKQKAIVSVDPLPINEKLLLVQDEQEAFGELVLSPASKISISEFERLEEEHSTRKEERKLRWPDADSFYLHRVKEFIPYEETRDIELIEGEANLTPLFELSEDEKEVIQLAERLPKTLILHDEAVTFEDGKAIFCEGLNGEKIAPILGATFDGKSVHEPLPLYQLALVRIPRLRLKKNSMEADMDDTKANPYQIVKDDKGCDGIAVIRKEDGKVMGCHGDDMEKARQQMEVLMKPEKKGEIEISEDEKENEDNKELSLDQKVNAIRDAFHVMMNPQMGKEPEYKPMPYINQVFSDYVTVGYNRKLYKVGYSINTEGKPVFDDKSKWVELEVQLMPTGNIGAKGIWEGYEEAVKTKSFSEWIEDYYSLENKSPVELSEEESIKAVWTGAYVNNLPDTSFLYIKPNCGEKDEEGKVKPRSCRMFPYKDGEGEIDLPHLRNAIARAPQADLPDDVKKTIQNKAKKLLAAQSEEKAGRRVKKTMVEELKAAWATLKKFLDWAEDTPEEEDEEEEMKFLNVEADSAIGIKKVGDEWWYVTWSSNGFMDREKEIFSTKSLEKYVVEAEKNGDRGYFNLWHITTKERPELTDFAEKKWQGVVGRFLIEAGPFLKDEKGKRALKFFKEYAKGHPDLAPEGWGCSIEYRYLPEERKSGVYHNIWITRTTTLPRLAAANIFTLGGVTMALTKEQKKAAVEIFGEDLAEEMTKAAESKTKELEEAGVAHKELEQSETTNSNDTTEELVKAVASKLQIELQPVADLLQQLAENQKLLGENQKSIDERLKSLETKTSEQAIAEAEKTKTDSPKYVFSLFERASEALKTVVPEGDDLKNKKPVEAKPTDKSGASHFFPGKR